MRKVFFILALLVSLTSCAKFECGEYDEILNNEERKKLSIAWADDRVFSHKFSENDFILGRVVGPGDMFATFSNDSNVLKVPEWFLGYEIRVLNKNKFDPEGIFIGKNSFQGIIITKNKIADYKENKLIKIGELRKEDERVGVVCVSKLK